MRFLVLIIGLLGAALATGGEPPALAQAASRCDTPRELIEDDAQLARARAAFPAAFPRDRPRHRRRLDRRDGARQRLSVFSRGRLRRRHPDVPITVINQGIAGETTEEMAARFPKDVYPRHPALVIWEAGTVDAVRGETIDAFVDTLAQGIADVEAHNSEIILMDMQYNPSTVSVINFEPYLDALHQTARLQNVYMFRRFDMMAYWSDSGRCRL